VITMFTISSVEAMTTMLNRLGMMWRKIMRASLVPEVRAASTR